MKQEFIPADENQDDLICAVAFRRQFERDPKTEREWNAFVVRVIKDTEAIAKEWSEHGAPEFINLVYQDGEYGSTTGGTMFLFGSDDAEAPKDLF